MGNCTSGGSNEGISSGIRTITSKDGDLSSIRATNGTKTMSYMQNMHCSTWAGPTSYSIDEGEAVYGLFPPQGHRRTRSGYSAQLAYDPVYERKMQKKKEIRQSQSMAEVQEGDEVGEFSPPPLGGISPVAPTSLRAKKTRPIRLKENRRMTRGDEVLAPRRAKLRSQVDRQMEALRERMGAKKEMEEASKEEDEGGKGAENVTPVASNNRASIRTRFSPPKPLDTSPAATPRTSHKLVQSPKGALKSPSRDRVVSPFNEDLSLDVQRSSQVIHSPKSGATSPKGARKSPSVARLKSPNGERGFFPDVRSSQTSVTSLSVTTYGPMVNTVLHSPLSGATSPKGKRKTPTGGGSSFTVTRKMSDENDGRMGNALLDAPRLEDLVFSPRARRGSRGSKKGGSVAQEAEGVGKNAEKWHCKPKDTVNWKQRSLKEGGGGHLHPSAKK